MIRASAVNALGVGLLDRLNGIRSRPGYSFSEGGPVQTSDSPHERFSGHVTIGLERGLIAREIRTPEGQQAIIQVLGEKPKAVQRAIGGR